MTTFSKNPHTETRKATNYSIFRRDLNQTLEQKFRHKKFSERFAMANTAFLGMGFIAQFASLTTAFTMLSYLFVNINLIVRIILAAALVLMIEVIKRESTDDVMKGIFQYKEVERFPAVLAIVAVCSSIYISVEGAKILPSLLISDAVREAPILKTPDSIESNYQKRIADLESERDTYRKNRLWKGRLARKDSKVIQDYNQLIQNLEAEKQVALASLSSNNDAAIQKAESSYQTSIQTIQQQRSELSKQLVIAAIGFEILFLLSMCFSWWYYTNCEKEKLQNAETPINTGRPTADPQQTYSSSDDLNEPEAHPAPKARKIGYIDHDKEQNNLQEIEKIKKEYTRICPQCNSGFIHKSHNHTFCSRACGVRYRESNT